MSQEERRGKKDKEEIKEDEDEEKKHYTFTNILFQYILIWFNMLRHVQDTRLHAGLVLIFYECVFIQTCLLSTSIQRGAGCRGLLFRNWSMLFAWYVSIFHGN